MYTNYKTMYRYIVTHQTMYTNYKTMYRYNVTQHNVYKLQNDVSI